jgi:acyl dehydratase
MATPALDQPVTRSVTATPDPPPVGIPNPIHAEAGASTAGYAGALVAGVRTYGWVAEAVVEVLGPGWLDDGWADVTLRRPVYAGDVVTIVVGPSGSAPSGSDARTVSAVVGERVVLDGAVGPGRASWAADIDPPAPGPALDPPVLRPTYTIDSAPVGQPLRPLGAYVSVDGARRLTYDDLGQTSSHVPDGLLHPWVLAARMAPLTRHNFTYGPTIHVRTQIQHCGPARAPQEIVVGARIVEVYDRKDHWYQVLDGLVVGGGGAPGGPELARIRHHSIFRPRGTIMPPPISGDPLA